MKNNDSLGAAGVPAAEARFRPITVDEVRVDGFFGKRIDTICASAARTLVDQCIKAGMLDQVDAYRSNPGLVLPFATATR